MGDLEVILGLLWVILVRSWALLVLSWCSLGALSWGPLGKRKLYVPWYRPPFLICVPWYWPPCAAVSRSGHPGGHSCIHGKRSREAPLGPTWDHGVPWGSLGALPGALLGSLGSLLGAPWSPLRVPWVSLGGFVKLLWGPLEPS